MKSALIIFVLLAAVLLTGAGWATVSSEPRLTLECKDPEYGFTIMLPENWKGFAMLHETWQLEEESGPIKVRGPKILIRHPKWTAACPFQDIIVWGVTPKQWQDNTQEDLFGGGHSLKEVGRTSQYVFGVLEPLFTLDCKDPDYGFSILLPESWMGFSILHQTWEVRDSGASHMNAQGPTILIRHPRWTLAKPFQDIPVWVFTPKQWRDDVQDHLIAGGYVLEVGRTEKYVFGVANRFNWGSINADDGDDSGTARDLAQSSREAGEAVDGQGKTPNTYY